MEAKDGQAIKDKVSIVLRGPDGKMKDEREIGQEESDEPDK